MSTDWKLNYMKNFIMRHLLDLGSDENDNVLVTWAFILDILLENV